MGEYIFIIVEIYGPFMSRFVYLETVTWFLIIYLKWFTWRLVHALMS
jgi:hypothetical protein